MLYSYRVVEYVHNFAKCACTMLYYNVLHSAAEIITVFHRLLCTVNTIMSTKGSYIILVKVSYGTLWFQGHEMYIYF